MEIIERLEELCMDIIIEKYNKHFKCKEVVDEIIALKYNTTVSYIVHSKRKLDYRFGKAQKELTPRIREILKKLEKDGIIKKYNATFWEKTINI